MLNVAHSLHKHCVHFPRSPERIGSVLPYWRSFIKTVAFAAIHEQPFPLPRYHERAKMTKTRHCAEGL
jgi:hypothetical protein